MASMAFCFTDIAGSTAIVRSLGDSAFVALLEQHRAIIRAALATAGGEEIHTEGDGFFLAFPDSTAALAFAVRAQREHAEQPWPVDGLVRVRIGIHDGEADRQPDGDYFGLDVHRAARVMAAAHGGQTLITASAAAGATLEEGCSLRPLGRYRLRDFDGLVALHQLIGPGLDDGFAPVRAARDGHGVPLPKTAMLGREHELTEVSELLRAATFVTLVGPGGVGKTRLALEAAALCAPDFPGGISVVELSSVDGPAQVLPALAATLGVRHTPDFAVDDAVIATLAPARHLVVLDSCERVLDGVAEVVEMLERRAPDTVVLATSIEAVRLPSERVLSLGPLPVPEVGQAPLDAAAVRLLVERAHAAGARLDLAAESATLADIARRLDGIPLALELAAARIAELGPADVATALDDRFSVLTNGYRTALPRHQTLEAAVAWSADLLKEEDRRLLARLARVLGRWRVPVALEAVAAGEADLARLTARSLVHVDAGRIRMLDTIRAFAARELPPLDADVVDDRRLDCIIRALSDARNEPERIVIPELRAFAPDVTDLVERLVERRPDDVTMMMSLALPLFEWTGETEVGLACLQRCIDARPSPAHRATALAGQSQLHFLFGRADDARAAAALALAVPEIPPAARVLALLAAHEPGAAPSEEWLDEAEMLARDRSKTLPLAVRSRRALYRAAAGDVETAIALFRSVAEEAHAGGFDTHEAQSLLNLGGLLGRTGRFAEADETLARGEALATAAGMLSLRNAALVTRATIALHLGDPDRAIELARERIALGDATGKTRGQAPALSVIGAAAMAKGDLDLARTTGEKMLVIARQSGHLESIVVGLFNLSVLASRQADLPDAARRSMELLAAASGIPMLERMGLFLVASLAAQAHDGDAAALFAAAGDPATCHHFDPTDHAWIANARAMVAAHPDETEPPAGWDGAIALASAVAQRLATG